MRYAISREGVLGDVVSLFKLVFSVDSRAFQIALQSLNLLNHSGIPSLILELQCLFLDCAIRSK